MKNKRLKLLQSSIITEEMVWNNFPKNEINFHLDNKQIMINVYSHVTDTTPAYKLMRIFDPIYIEILTKAKALINWDF